MPPMPPASAPPKGPPQGAPPMPPRSGGAPPMKGPPPAQAGGGGGPEAQFKQEVERTVSQFPPGRFSKAALSKLADTIAASMPDILGKHAPPDMGAVKQALTAAVPQDKMLDGPVPQILATATVILLFAAAKADPTYTFDVTTVNEDSGVLEMIAKLKAAAKDPDVKKAAEGGDMDAEEEGDEPPEDTAEEEMDKESPAAKYM